jgi:hypothetical protein
MPGNWAQYQNINGGNGRVEWPTGPLTVGPNEVPKWIEAWVLQSSSSTTPPAKGVEGTGASQSSRQSSGWEPGYGHWTADGPPAGWTNGMFLPGLPAVGIALESSRDNSTNPPTNKFFWWSDVIILY